LSEGRVIICIFSALAVSSTPNWDLSMSAKVQESGDVTDSVMFSGTFKTVLIYS
jgi:hypothetical protein